jgi:hypothetical protein
VLQLAEETVEALQVVVDIVAGGLGAANGDRTATGVGVTDAFAAM